MSHSLAMTSFARALIRRAAVATALALATACGQKGDTPLPDDLQRDLDRTRQTGLELAPHTGRTDVTSAEERAAPGRGDARVGAPRRVVGSARDAGDQPSARQQTAASTEDSVLAIPPTPPRPRPVQPAPTRKGTKSVGDVIRDAPFPINP
jgi:predicted small lipoprotein YifL